MASFQYTALSQAGTKTTGVVSAANRAAAATEVKRLSLTPVSIHEVDGAAAKPSGLAALKRSSRIKQRDLATAYQQIADLLNAGVPLLRALNLVARRKNSPALASAYAELATRVEDGEELASAMQRQPHNFPHIHTAMIRAGEKGGFLEQSLTRLSALVLRQVDLKEKVRGAAAYPLVIGSIGVLIMLGLFLFLVPLLRKQFEGEVALPPISRIVFFTSDLMTSKWWLGLLIVTALVAAVLKLRTNERARDIARTIVLRTPTIGPLIRDLAVARFARTLSSLLAAGVPLLAALRITRDVAGLKPMEEAIERAEDAVRHGDSLAEQLGTSPLFPPDLIEMMTVAEAANALDATLDTAADALEAKVDRQIGVTLKLIEPLLLLTLGTAIAFVALALILPMFGLMNQIAG